MSDLISRQDAIDAINQREWLTQDAKEILAEVLEQLPSAEPEKRTYKRTKMHTCDLISRHDAIDINVYFHGQMPNEVNYEIYKKLMQLPSAEPEIIRCKDCKWKNKYNCTRAVEVFVHDDCYCSWAERGRDE